MIIFFDTETNGLWRRDLGPNHSDQPHLVSLAFQVCDSEEKVIMQYSSRIQPMHGGYLIPKDVEKIHGISTDIANETGVPCKSALWIFQEYLERCDSIVAHNTAFDIQIMKREFDAYGMKWYEPKKTYCTMMTSKDELKLQGEYKDFKFPKLQECFDHFFHRGVQNYHDALLDVQLCRELFFHLKRKGIELKGPQDIPKELLLRIDGERYKSLVKFLKEIDATKLNEWELDFCKSVIDKLDKYDEHILLSKKQHSVLRKIYGKFNS